MNEELNKCKKCDILDEIGNIVDPMDYLNLIHNLYRLSIDQLSIDQLTYILEEFKKDR